MIEMHSEVPNLAGCFGFKKSASNFHLPEEILIEMHSEVPNLARCFGSKKPVNNFMYVAPQRTDSYSSWESGIAHSQSMKFTLTKQKKATEKISCGISKFYTIT